MVLGRMVSGGVKGGGGGRGRRERGGEGRGGGELLYVYTVTKRDFVTKYIVY